MDAPDGLDPDVIWGKRGCCPECGSPFCPREDQVGRGCYALWDDTLSAVRGVSHVYGVCQVCHTALVSQSFSGTDWEDIDPLAAYWCRDYHSPYAGPRAAPDGGK
jgi:hypothetical protein